MLFFLVITLTRWTSCGKAVDSFIKTKPKDKVLRSQNFFLHFYSLLKRMKLAIAVKVKL